MSYTAAMQRTHIALATILLILWTAFLGYMYQRETALAENRLKDLALGQARALFNQVVDVREWNARHGGSMSRSPRKPRRTPG